VSEINFGKISVINNLSGGKYEAAIREATKLSMPDYLGPIDSGYAPDELGNPISRIILEKGQFAGGYNITNPQDFPFTNTQRFMSSPHTLESTGTLPGTDTIYITPSFISSKDLITGKIIHEILHENQVVNSRVLTEIELIQADNPGGQFDEQLLRGIIEHTVIEEIIDDIETLNGINLRNGARNSEYINELASYLADPSSYRDSKTPVQESSESSVPPPPQPFDVDSSEESSDSPSYPPADPNTGSGGPTTTVNGNTTTIDFGNGTVSRRP